MANAQALNRLAEVFGDGFGAAGDDVALLDEVVPGHGLALLVGGRAELGDGARLEGADRAVARRVGEAFVDVEAFLVEVFHMLGVLFFGFFVGFGDADELEEAGAVGVVVHAEPVHFFPKAVHHLDAALVAGVAEVAVDVVHSASPLPGFHAAAAGDPDGGVRLLEGAGPDVGVADLVVFAVEGEGFGFCPRFHHEVVRLIVLFAEGGGG